MKQVKGIDARGYCLYELTERDLSFLVDHDYHVGNILIFSSNNKARLGREVGRANNLKAAEEFLSSLSEKSISFPLEGEASSSPADAVSRERGATLQERGATLQERGVVLLDKDEALFKQLDKLEGLRNEDVRRYERKIEELTLENEEFQKSLAEKSKRINELSFLSLQNDIQREELINDLKEVSNISTVKTVIELDELRIKIVELETQLVFEKDRSANLESSAVLLSAEKSVLEHELEEGQKQLEEAQRQLGASPKAGDFQAASETEQELILTNSSGGVIHIYHEFPPIPKHSIGRRLFSQARLVFFVIIGILAVAYIFYLSSVLETMRASGIDVSNYSDAVLNEIRSLFGF